MISQKMQDLAKNGSAIRAMFEEGKKMAAQFGKDNVYDFSLGNPCTPTPDSVRTAAIDLLNNTDTLTLHGYMSNAGYEDVREAVAKSINRRFGMDYTAANLVMCVGAGGALNVALKTVIDRGDEIVLQAPYFGEYNNYINNFDGVRVVAEPNYDDFSLNLPDIEKKIGPKTKAVIINSPNNPTGAVYSEEQIKELADLLDRKQKEYGHEIYLISDEPYREIVYDGHTVPYLPKYYANTFVGYSYSKSLSLPGERIGFLVINSAMTDFEEVAQAASTANRILGYVNAPSLFQKVIGRCVDETTDISLYKRNLAVLYDELTRDGYQMVKPQGTFYMFPKSPVADERIFTEAAKKYHILIVPGFTFACPGYFRLAFCVSEKTVDGSLEGFRSLAKDFGMI